MFFVFRSFSDFNPLPRKEGDVDKFSHVLAVAFQSTPS